MISSLCLERMALFGALSALVLAIFWPHVRPKLLPILDKLILSPLSVLFKSQDANQREYPNKQRIAQDHPKFSGLSLNRMTSEKQSIRSAYRSFEGLRQSPLTGNPSFSTSNGYPPSSGLPTRGHISLSPSTQNNQSSMMFTVFTASIIALIIYTLMRMLSARFGGGCRSDGRWRGKESSSHKINTETRDLRRDKRKLARLSREERARQLILQHGGRNVSSAIRFLAGELEKQKRSLVENLSENLSCTCSCHSNGGGGVNGDGGGGGETSSAKHTDEDEFDQRSDHGKIINDSCAETG